jgi:hypothetical protein
MKAKELRAILSEIPKDKLLNLTVEFYKLIPKAQQGMAVLDDYIETSTRKKKKKPIAELTLADIEQQINEFIIDVRNQDYLYPNEMILKKERLAWRSKVKRWGKALTKKNRVEVDIPKQVELLTNLYQVLCESCVCEYFSAYDAFQSIGVKQVSFYRNILKLLQKIENDNWKITQGIILIVDNPLNTYTLYPDLIIQFVKSLRKETYYEKAVHIAQGLLIENDFNFNKNTMLPDPVLSESETYKKEEKHNNLTELLYRLHVKLSDYTTAIDCYKKYYYCLNEEIKLSILVSLLFEKGKKKLIKKEIELAIKNGIEPRENLLNLLSMINNENLLPQYM